MSRSFVAWLLVTLGFALLSVSVVLVPDNVLADDGDPPTCGTCTYRWDGFMWTLMGATCTEGCFCPSPTFPPGTTPGEERTANCEVAAPAKGCEGDRCESGNGRKCSNRIYDPKNPNRSCGLRNTDCDGVMSPATDCAHCICKPTVIDPMKEKECRCRRSLTP